MTILEKIAASRRPEIERLKASEPLEEIVAAIENAPPARFEAGLKADENVKIIAELKKRSPSKGLLAENFNPLSLADSYCQGGADALSVLTEPSFFEGSYEILQAVRRAVDRPVLCKDFVVDRYQIFHARYIGADAILLIVALQSPAELARHLRVAEHIGIDCLVEVHDAEELRIALEAGAKIVGVNNRNLNDFSVSLTTAEELAGSIPPDVVRVAESGIDSRRDIKRLQRSGYNCFLIGETLVKAVDPIAKLKELRGR